MADMEFDEFGRGYAAGRRPAGRMVHLAGAACSIALILGLVVWGYKLAVRDVTGIPVMRAMAGPMRIAPANPGGEVADNQGLSVNAVAASGTAMPMAETVVLAPHPVDLTTEDLAGLVPADANAAAVNVSELAAQEPTLQLAASQQTEAPVTQSGEDAVALALAAALADDPAPLSPLAEGVETTSVDASAPLEPVVTGQGLERSPRPMPRPTPRSEASTATPVAVEVDPSTIVVGTRLVQLGAFDDAETARSEWSKLQDRFGELLSAKSMVVQTAQSGGRTFFRLRATGFEGEEDARRFCVALLAENVSCIPVAQR